MRATRSGGVFNQILTIARQTLIQAVRMKIVLVLAVFLIVLVPSLPFLLKTDNTLDGQIRMIITYTLYLTGFLLSVITVFLSVAALNYEIKGRHIFMIDPKPIHRFTLLVGKWAGIMFINLVLLIAMMGTTYGLVRWFGRSPKPVDIPKLVKLLQDAGVESDKITEFKTTQRKIFTGTMEPEDTVAFEKSAETIATQLSKNPENRAVSTAFAHAVEISRSAAQNYQDTKVQVMTARIARSPQLPELGKWVDERVAAMKRENMMPQGRDENWVRTVLTRRFSRAAWYVPAGGRVHWKISNLPKFDGWLVVRFKFIRDRGPAEYELPVRFVISGKDNTQAEVKRAFAVDKQHTFSVRSSLIRDDGTIDIEFENVDKSKDLVGAMFPFQGGIQVLCPAASMGENFIRAGGIILAKLSFIAILGVFASTFLSFPVGVFMTMVVFLAGHLRGYFLTDVVSDLYVFGSSIVPPGTPLNPADEVLRHIFYWVFWIFPNFAGYDVVQPVAEGALVDASSLIYCFFSFVLCRGGVLAIAAWLIFRRRELAALTPQS